MVDTVIFTFATSSDTEVDFFVGDEEGLEGEISVYSKISIRADGGKSIVSNLESPSVRIRSNSGDIELNSVKIANSILGEAIHLSSKSGDITLNGRTVGDIKCETPKGTITGGTLQSLTIDLRAENIQLESAYAG